MKVRRPFHNRLLAAGLLLFALLPPAFAQTAKLDGLFARLLSADAAASKGIEQEIWIEWSKSGSAAIDLLLERGRMAMAAGRTGEAI